MALPFKLRFLASALFILTLTLLSSSQTLFPSPEQQRMGYFAGHWELQGTMKISPNTPASPFTATERGEWVKGNFFLETHSTMTSVLGDTRSTRVMEYNPDDKVYTYNIYNSLGEHQMAVGHVTDNTGRGTPKQK